MAQKIKEVSREVYTPMFCKNVTGPLHIVNWAFFDADDSFIRAIPQPNVYVGDGK